MSHQGFSDIKAIIEKLKREYRVGDVKRELEALRLWPEIVGERLSAHSKPLWVKHGVLHVETDGAAWRQEVVFRATEIVERLNDGLGRPMIKEIRYRDAEKKKSD